MSSELDQTRQFSAQTNFPGLKRVLDEYAATLKAAPVAPSPATDPVATPVVRPPTVSTPSTEAQVRSAPAFVGVQKQYVPIESFSWDQGDYNSPTVTIYVDIDGVGSVKDAVTCDFGVASFDLKVPGLNGLNYRLVKDNLHKDIIPTESKFVVKRDKVVIKLKKVKGEYSYENWTSLTSKKSREAEAARKKDPMGGIMDMMKDMYEEGDDNMKKIIGEAMLKSQRGEKPGAPDMAI